MNAAAEIAFGRPRASLLGQSIWEELPATIDSGLHRACRTALADGVTMVGEHIDAVLGARYRVTAVPSPPGLLVVLHEAQIEPLSLEEERILERGPAILFMLDADGTVKYLSGSFSDMTGLSSAPARALQLAIASQDRQGAESALRSGIESGRAFELRTRLRARGRPRWFHFQVTPLIADGLITGWVGAALDVEGFVKDVELLADASRRKDDFLAVLAHELRNPLAPIRAGIHVLREAHATPSQIDRARDMLERQARHLARMVDDLLDISRIARGSMLLNKSRLDLVELVRGVANDHRAMLEGAGLSLKLVLPEKPVFVNGDVNRLVQVLGNLLHNAMKFTDPGGRVTLRVLVDPRANVVRASVEDTGIGMDPEMLARVFEAFQEASAQDLGGNVPARPRLPTSLTGLFEAAPERSRGGLGLGLALAHGLVSLHGGRLLAESEVGRGSKLSLELPVERRVAPRAPRKVAADVIEAVAGPRRILLIEDNVDSAESLSMLLELAGHRVEVAHTGRAGIEAARHFQPEVVFCDIGLPGINGYEVARVLRSDPELGWAHIIAMTGYGQEEDQRLSREAGFEMHLTKPVDPVALKRLVAGLPRRAPGAGEL